MLRGRLIRHPRDAALQNAPLTEVCTSALLVTLCCDWGGWALRGCVALCNQMHRGIDGTDDVLPVAQSGSCTCNIRGCPQELATNYLQGNKSHAPARQSAHTTHDAIGPVTPGAPHVKKACQITGAANNDALANPFALNQNFLGAMHRQPLVEYQNRFARC